MNIAESFDRLFKISLIVLAIISLYFYAKSSGSGRYQYCERLIPNKLEPFVIILDTQTGELSVKHPLKKKIPTPISD